MIQITSLTLLLATAGLCTAAFVKPPPSGDNFELLILHNNDMHARFEQTSQLSGACTTADREAGKCYGGFPRVAHVVKEARKAAASGEGPPVLYLNAGDTYTGTAWFTIYKWKIAAEFINALQPDAVALGNNEIEKGSSKMSPFINNIQTKILASNVLLKSENSKNIQKSLVFDINGVKVGVVGYLTPDKSILDDDINLEYIDEVLAVKEEVETLEAMGVNIIIALGHATLDKNIEIAKEVEGIDLVIAGQKNKFNFDGSTKDYAAVEEPIIVTQESGRKVPIVQSSSYNKYLGSLLTKFDVNGEVVEFNSKPILLDEFVQEDSEALQILQSHHDELTAKSSEVVGTTAVILDGNSCKSEECNFGNLIADAMTYYYAINYEGDIVWTGAAISIIPSGYIASSIAPTNRPASITQGDLLQALPQESNLVVVTMSGTVLLQVLEQSVANYSVNNPTGQFLQVSGIRAIYDLSKEPGSRLVEVLARCFSCFVPQYFSIDNWRTYHVIMPASLAQGEYGYTMLRGLFKETLAYDEVTCVSEYIKIRSPVYPEVAERIVLSNVPQDESETGPEESETGPEESETGPEESETGPEESETGPEESEPGSAVRFTSSSLIVVTLLSIVMN